MQVDGRIVGEVQWYSGSKKVLYSYDYTFTWVRKVRHLIDYGPHTTEHLLVIDHDGSVRERI